MSLTTSVFLLLQPAEYSVIEREIKQTVRRLRKRVAAEMKLECEMNHPPIDATMEVSTTSNKRQCQQQQQLQHTTTPPPPAVLFDTTKYCDRGLEDFVHHYETKQLKTTIAKVILAEQEIQRARGVHDPVALMQVSMACTQLSRQQAISLAEQDAEDVQQIFQQQQQQSNDAVVVERGQVVSDNNEHACRFLFSKDMTSICDDITLTSTTTTKENEPSRPAITLLSICDPTSPPRIRSELPMSG
jgi:hypothetical protein